MGLLDRFFGNNKEEEVVVTSLSTEEATETKLTYQLEEFDLSEYIGRPLSEAVEASAEELGFTIGRISSYRENGILVDATTLIKKGATYRVAVTSESKATVLITLSC